MLLRLPPPIKSGKVAAKPALAKKAAPAKASSPAAPRKAAASGKRLKQRAVRPPKR